MHLNNPPQTFILWALVPWPQVSKTIANQVSLSGSSMRSFLPLCGGPESGYPPITALKILFFTVELHYNSLIFLLSLLTILLQLNLYCHALPSLIIGVREMLFLVSKVGVVAYSVCNPSQTEQQASLARALEYPCCVYESSIQDPGLITDLTLLNQCRSFARFGRWLSSGSIASRR